MAIKFACSGCGKSYSVKDELAGRKAKCACGQMMTVPVPAPVEAPEDDIFAFKDDVAPRPMRQTRTVAQPAAIGAGASLPGSRTAVPAAHVTTPPPLPTPPIPPAAAVRAQLPLQQRPATSATRRFAYLLLLAALLPLGWSVLAGKPFDFEEALTRTVEKHPEVGGKIAQIMESETASMDDFFNALPDHRLEGSHLSHDTYVHWLYALISSAAFTALILLIFPRTTQTLGWMIGVGLFTATIGIFMLLGFQWIADWTQGYWVTGRSILVLLFYIVKFIGYSYRAALDPESGFFMSTIGFTLGVGLCEELCKAAPVLFHYQTKAEWPWRTACVVGLISGIGFGVSEGIHYSSDMYNGITGGEIYLVRFVSCVALHAVWSGAAAVFIFRHQAQLQQSESVWGGAVTWVALLIVPMVLHGLYDTLLKKDMAAWALLTALASFGWLIYQIECARRDFPEEDAALATA